MTIGLDGDKDARPATSNICSDWAWNMRGRQAVCADEVAQSAFLNQYTGKPYK